MLGSLYDNRPHVTGQTELTVLDICTGAGGEALGLELAGFTNAASIENDLLTCQTLRQNRPSWRVIESDIREVNGLDFRGVDLLAGGVPCPPFTIAGKQLGADDERDLFPEALRLIEQAKPAAVMLENVPGFASAKFAAYRNDLIQKLLRLRYEVTWCVLNSSDYAVPSFGLALYLSRCDRPTRMHFVGLLPKMRPLQSLKPLETSCHFADGVEQSNGAIKLMVLPRLL